MNSSNELYRSVLVYKSGNWRNDFLSALQADVHMCVSTLQEVLSALKGAKAISLILLDIAFLEGVDPSNIADILEEIGLIPIIVFGASIEEADTLELIGNGIADVIVFDSLDDSQISMAKRTIARVMRREKYSSIALAKQKTLQNRLLSAAHSFPGLLWICNAEGERVFFSHGWTALTGKTGEDLRTTWDLYIKPQERKNYLEEHAKAASERKPLRAEVQIRDRDGNFIRFSENSVPLFTSDGMFAGYAGYLSNLSSLSGPSVRRDITIGSTRESNTVDMAPIGILNMNNDLVVKRVNEFIVKTFGKEKDFFLGKSILEIFSIFDREMFDEVRLSGSEYQMDNRKVSLKDCPSSDPPCFDISVWPMLDRERKSVGLAMSFTEITGRTKSVQRKEDMIASLVHDLKTPLIGADLTLAAMLGGAVGPLDEKHSHFLSILKNSNRSLIGMIQNFIEVFRCENDILRLSLHPVSVFSIAIECAEELRVLFEQRGVLLTVSEVPGGKAAVLGDQVTLRRIIMNLLDNALKFTPQGGKVDLILAAGRDSVSVSVVDTGVGICEADRNKVFDKCWQGSDGKQLNGTAGLGLFICQEFARIHGGRITLESSPGKGSKFTLTVPLLGKNVLTGDVLCESEKSTSIS